MLRHRPHRGEPVDAGFAMMMVLVTMMALMLFMTASVAAVVQNSKSSRAQQDSRYGTAAAQAGIEDFLGRLQENSEYWRYSTDSACPVYNVIDTVNCGNVDTTNSAFLVAGATIPGSTTGARFTYRMLNSVASLNTSSVSIQLQVTGWSSAGNGGRVVNRVLRAELQRTGSTSSWSPQNAYFTDYEVADPSQFGSGVTRCGNYYYGRNAGTVSAADARSGVSTCPEVPWFTGDQVSGPVASNDEQYIVGNPTFNARPRTAFPNAAKNYWGAGTPTNTPQGGAGAVGNLPSDNSYLLKNVLPGPGGTRPAGCLYKGATRITFSGTQMSVYSPLTTTPTAGCFSAAQSSSAQTFPIPPLIYVQATSVGSCPSLGYPAAQEFTGGVYQDAAGGPQFTPDYSCNRGTAYVSGDVTGALTIGTENDVVVGGNLTVNDTVTSMIGLNAGMDVWVYHPVKANGSTVTNGPVSETRVSSCTAGTTTPSAGTTVTITCSSRYCTGTLVFGSCLFGTFVYDKNTTTVTVSSVYANLLSAPVTTIQASILTGAGSLVVQNFNRGAALSTATTNRLTVYGSVSQKWRGPVAAMPTSTATAPTYTTGYLVNYTLDPRLPAQLPPYFIDPGLTTWRQILLTDG